MPQVGNGSASSKDVLAPVKIGYSTSWTQLSAGWGYSCGISAGKVFCWGEESWGQLGDGAAAASEIKAPIQVGTLSDWTQVSTKEHHTCGILSGSLYCWGVQAAGRLGDGIDTVAAVVSPIRIGVSNNWLQISVGNTSTCGIESGALYCWGTDSDGQVGNGAGSAANVLTPLQIGASPNWSHVSVGNNHVCGVDNGALYCWGSDVAGQLGNGAGGSTTAPVQIGIATGWSEIALGINRSCGIEAGKLYCWGNLFEISGGVQTTPIQIGVSTNWSKISTNGGHNCGINSGKLKCWGKAANGRTGTIYSATTAPFKILEYN